MGQIGAVRDDPQFNPSLQRAFACMCYRLLDYLTAEWVDLAPVLLGQLLPIVRRLPPHQTLGSHYPHRFPEPPIPSLLFNIFTLREQLSQTSTLLSESNAHIRIISSVIPVARHNYQRAFTSSSQQIRLAARYQLFAAHMKVCGAVIDAQLRLAERGACWDRLVRLLRGNTFHEDCLEFIFDNSDRYEQPDIIWHAAFPLALRNAYDSS
jgi:hypothetical protein